MRWTLRQQILSPLMLAAILVVFWLFGSLTARRLVTMDLVEDQTVLSIAKELRETKVARDELPPLLERLKREYAGWEFAIFDGSNLLTSTLPLMDRDRAVLQAFPSRRPDEPGRDHRVSFESALQGPRAWFWITKFEGQGGLTGLDIAALYSASYAEALDAEMGFQDEVAAAALTGILVVFAFWYAGRLSQRIVRIQQQVRRIADGRTSEPVDAGNPDEIGELARSVNQMAADLDSMKKQVAQAERARLHAQISRGISHELRNGIHAARLALEMFREDEEPGKGSPLLTTSYNQLSMTEIMVRRLLAIGQPTVREIVPRPLREILDDSAQLLVPIFHHAQVQLAIDLSDGVNGVVCRDGESMQSAIVNLGLNALEAAGRHGTVRLSASREGPDILIGVRDSGPGPAPNVAETIFEPFVTTKPEGVGLGLVLVRQAVLDAGGRVGWHRENEQTMFWIRIPAEPRDEAQPVSAIGMGTAGREEG